MIETQAEFEARYTKWYRGIYPEKYLGEDKLFGHKFLSVLCTCDGHTFAPPLPDGEKIHWEKIHWVAIPNTAEGIAWHEDAELVRAKNKRGETDE